MVTVSIVGRPEAAFDAGPNLFYNVKSPRQDTEFVGRPMAARAIPSLAVSFGLVSIPVKLFSATEASRAISFNLLHRTCGSRLKQQYFCIKEEVPVARDDMVKGYEFAKDQYVTFTPEELKAMEEAGTGMAEITEFVPIEAIDPVYFDKAYYLAPDKGGAKPFALLASALRESKRCALGRWAARGKQYIVMIRPVEDGLVMQQLLYGGEVRSIKEIEIPKTEVKDAELKLAQQLIEQQASDKFDPAAYTDEVRARIETAVQKKVEGQEITMAEEPQGGAEVIDLMEALRASLDKKKTPAPAKAPPRPTSTPLRELRRPPPDARPPWGLWSGAVGDRGVVSEGASRWQAESGQYLLAFDGDPADGSLSVVERNDAGAAASAEDWFERGCRLEGRDPGAAREAYGRALEADPTHLAPRINLGRLLHQAGRPAEAELVDRGG